MMDIVCGGVRWDWRRSVFAIAIASQRNKQAKRQPTTARDLLERSERGAEGGRVGWGGGC